MFSFNKKCKIDWRLFLNSFLSIGGVVIYVIFISLVIQNGDKIFGQMNNVTGLSIFLLLFVFSALITGALILGLPLWYYLKNKKRKSWLQFIYNIIWFFIILFIIAIIRFFWGK